MFRCCVNKHATTLNCNCTDHTETRRSETFVSTNSLAAGPVACWFLLVLPVFPRRPKKKEKKKNNKKKQKAQVPSVIQCRETMTTQLGHSKATPVGFEPTRGDPIGLAGRRLNHSAKVSMCAFAEQRHVHCIQTQEGREMSSQPKQTPRRLTEEGEKQIQNLAKTHPSTELTPTLSTIVAFLGLALRHWLARIEPQHVCSSAGVVWNTTAVALR